MAGQGLYRTEKESLKTAFYTGTDTIKRGYALCYDRNTTTAVDGSGTAIGATSSSWGRHGHVEKPASGNLHNFAGIVAGERDRTGPCLVSLIEPDSVARVMEVFTSANCTLDVTILTVVAGSYELGAVGEGTVIGKALQTIDRSSTSGLAQAMIWGVSGGYAAKPYGDAVPSSTNNVYSASIWESCPLNEIRSGLVPGSIYENDYLGGFQPVTATTTTAIEDWIQTEVVSGQTLVSDAPGGVLRVSSEAFNAADDGLTVMYRQHVVVPNTGKNYWAEFRIRVNDIADTPDQFYIGISDVVATVHASGVIDDLVDKVAFFTHSGSTVATLSFITSKTTVQEITTSAATGVADSTWLNVGFVSNGLTSVTPHVNGVAGTAHTTASQLPTAATGLAICYAAHTDQTATVATLDIDKVRIVQLL